MYNLVKLNLARNCIKYLIRAYGIKEIFIPYYTCDTVWKAAREENCIVRFYHIDKDFKPLQTFSEEDFIVYNNYFGLNSKNCETLSLKYKNLIVDNTQAFYTKPVGLAAFYSLRKFFPVQNGAYLYTQKLISAELDEDLTDIEYFYPHKDYNKFLANELFLDEQKNIKKISSIVEKQMLNIDFESDKFKRREIYSKYFEQFASKNKIYLPLDEDDIPYCYPFCPKDSKYKDDLLNKNIPLIRLWKSLPESFVENITLNDVVALPLDEFSKFFL